MQTKTKRKITSRDVADWALFFVIVHGGTIIAMYLFGKTHPVYSVEKFVDGLVVSIPIYWLMRKIKPGRFLLRQKLDE